MHIAFSCRVCVWEGGEVVRGVREARGEKQEVGSSDPPPIS